MAREHFSNRFQTLTFQTRNFLEHQWELCICTDDELWLQVLGSTVFHVPVFQINEPCTYNTIQCNT